ncbi:MAG: hypothetical protein K940chlam2_00627 [Chlamydiae bacterium]|nr:hypothetical protein [Chlamydiota bacterium]
MKFNESICYQSSILSQPMKMIREFYKRTNNRNYHFPQGGL